MKLLLDESIPKRLKSDLSEFDVKQIVENYNIAVVVLDAVSNKYEELTKFIPSLVDKIHTLEKGEIHTVSI